MAPAAHQVRSSFSRARRRAPSTRTPVPKHKAVDRRRAPSTRTPVPKHRYYTRSSPSEARTLILAQSWLITNEHAPEVVALGGQRSEWYDLPGACATPWHCAEVPLPKQTMCGISCGPLMDMDSRLWKVPRKAEAGGKRVATCPLLVTPSAREGASGRHERGYGRAPRQWRYGRPTHRTRRSWRAGAIAMHTGRPSRGYESGWVSHEPMPYPVCVAAVTV